MVALVLLLAWAGHGNLTVLYGPYERLEKAARYIFRLEKLTMRFASIFFALILFPLAALSQVQEKPVNVRNAGSFECGRFLPVIRQQGREVEKTAFLNWAAAYATAAARANSLIDVFPIGDSWEFLIMVSLVCTENEEATFETALRTAMRRLQPYWVRTSPSFVVLNDPQGRTVKYYTEAVQALQKALNRYGADIAADGAYGNQTGNAIRRVNEARGTKAWMTPDGELLYQLTRPEQ